MEKKPKKTGRPHKKDHEKYRGINFSASPEVFAALERVGEGSASRGARIVCAQWANFAGRATT